MATEKDPRDLTYEEWMQWRKDTGRFGRRPLSRSEAMKWQRETYGNRAPSAKEVEVRQELATWLDINDQLKGNK